MSKIEQFYNEHAHSRFIENYLNGNPRVERQFDYLRRAIHRRTRAVLIVGCGCGEVAWFLARKVCPGARILAVDISPEYIRIARRLFPHPRVRYRRMDVLEESIPGKWDIIIFPDVYEHIPRDARSALHAKLDAAMTETGRVIITAPTPGHQDHLRERGQGLQIVDEDVTPEDYLALARDIHASLTYLSAQSIYRTNDYFHVMIERDAERIRPVGELDCLPVKGLAPGTLIDRVRGRWHQAAKYLRRLSRQRRLVKLGIGRKP